LHSFSLSLTREEEHSNLRADLEKQQKVASRKSYTHRIEEITKNSRKQDADIERILKETREVQLESNSIHERLHRTYAVADEMVFRYESFSCICNREMRRQCSTMCLQRCCCFFIFHGWYFSPKVSNLQFVSHSYLCREAKKDPTGQQVYKLLVNIHKGFEQISEKILATDRIRREVSEYEMKLAATPSTSRSLDLSKLQSDLDTIIIREDEPLNSRHSWVNLFTQLIKNWQTQPRKLRCEQFTSWSLCHC